MCRVNVRVGLQQKGEGEERKASRVEGEEKKLLTHTQKKKLELEEGDVGVKGEIYGGRLLLHSAAPGEAKEEGWREGGKTFPFPFLSFCLYRSHTGGGELCLRMSGEEWRGGGVFLHRKAAWS